MLASTVSRRSRPDCPLWLSTELKKKSGYTEEDVGVFVWEKGKVAM